VAYRRGAIAEQYVLRPGSIEQRFVIDEPVALAGEDLVIAGVVDSGGAFEALEDGWRWRDDDGAVHLGNVRVYDASGKPLSAAMRVTAHSTRITVAEAALADAVYPVTIDPEIGANDFRISDMGPDGDSAYGVIFAAVAWNAVNNEYLVVWVGDDNTAPLVNDEFEVFGQRFSVRSVGIPTLSWWALSLLALILAVAGYRARGWRAGAII
jgi:hypothetical protein